MKKAMLTLIILAVAGASVPWASAGDREWATAGKILTGIVAGPVIAKAIEQPPVYVAPPPVVYVQPAPAAVFPPPANVVAPAPVYVQPAPVYVQPAPIYVQAAPVYYVPAAPVHIAPRPLVSFQFGFGGHHPHAPRRVICW